MEIVTHEGEAFEQWVGETVVTFARPALRGSNRGGRPHKGDPIEVRAVIAQLRGIDELLQARPHVVGRQQILRLLDRDLQIGSDHVSEARGLAHLHRHHL